jgi:hypothetical protein
MGVGVNHLSRDHRTPLTAGPDRAPLTPLPPNFLQALSSRAEIVKNELGSCSHRPGQQSNRFNRQVFAAPGEDMPDTCFINPTDLGQITLSPSLLFYHFKKGLR